ncbi:MAG: tetratricopeptide repeat protein [Prochloraceae cyanobacterium]|nr:tetratricopeptide repeat protein [Prochloraceae cyanobacterium]
MDRFNTENLLADLKNPDREIRNAATAKLWQSWFEQKGEMGLQNLIQAGAYLDSGQLQQAESLLTAIIAKEPDFAEAWNRRALIYYLRGEYEKSKRDCQEVVKLNSIHFGAWHGLGLCHGKLQEYVEAIAALRKALEIQPYSLENKRLILEYTARLN